MAAWRWATLLGVIAGLLLTVGAGSAQTYSLIESAKPGDCFRLHLEMTLNGELRVSREGKPRTLKQSATAIHEFPERILNVDAAGLADKSARIYEKAKATITVAGDRSELALRPDRRLLVAQRLAQAASLCYSPAGPLLQEEVELTDHFDTLALSGLLPGRPVKTEETWKVANPAAQALCHFEGLTEQHLTCKLLAVKDNTATVSVTGTATGIELGALVKLTIDATYHFDLNAKRLTWLEWKQKDEREQGPASPAATVDVTTTVKRTVIDTPKSLSDVALVSAPGGKDPPPPQMTQLLYIDPKWRFELVHGREWQPVGRTDDHLVLRLMERGDFVAQVTVTPWTKAEPGKHMAPEAFAEEMSRTPGWTMDRELQAGEVRSEGSSWIYRISALGTLDGTNVMQNFYLVAGPAGQQVVLVFTMTPKQADRLGSRDLSLAGSIDFPANRKDPEKVKQP
jgi:hypothetical protein